MRAVRAYDGRAIVVNQPLAHFPALDDLLDCFSLATEIPSDAIICMTSDGRQLTQDLLNQIIQESAQPDSLSRSSEAQQEYYVFNREFLYTDPTALAGDLALSPVLEPLTHLSDVELSFPPTPRSLEALVSWAAQVAQHTSTHEQRCRELFQCISSIARSTYVALLNLKSHAEKIETGAQALVGDIAGKELARMQSLLNGYERDLHILGMVTIHPRLQSSSGAGSQAATNSASNGKPKHRTLGDYISKTKMSAVGEACGKVYAELRDRIDQIQNDLGITRQDTLDLALEVENTNPDVSEDTYQKVVEADSRAGTLHSFIQDTCSPDAQGWPVADKLSQSVFEQVIQSFDELVLLDETVREAVQRLTQDRNDILERSLHLLIDISSLQSEFAETGALLAAVDADLHSNKIDGFKHLSRLKNMLWAYGASVVEVVRRREFAKHFLGKSQSLAELMAKLSASEWKRRQLYRADVSSLLPWEVKGMEDKPPSLEITTPRVSSEGMADLGVADLEALYSLLDQIDLKLSEEDMTGPNPIPEVKSALQRLAAALQDLDDEFIHLVHLQLLGAEEDLASDEEDDSGSDTSIRARKRLRRRSRIAASSKEVERLKTDLAAAKESQARTQIAADERNKEVLELQAEIRRLKELSGKEKAATQDLRTNKEQLNSKLEALTADLELEKERRLNMVDEVNQLRRDLEQSHRSEAEARQELLEEGDRGHELETHLNEMQVELEEAKAARIDASNRIEALLSEGSSVESELRTAQARIDELTEQMSAAHSEASKARELTAEIESTKERQIRSHRAEADGDRAILEERVRSLKAEIEDKQKQIDIQAKAMAETERNRLPDQQALDLLREQLRAADIAHEEIVQQMESAKALADEADSSRKDIEASRQVLLERSRLLLAKSCLLRKTVRAIPVHSSRHASSASAGATATPPSSTTTAQRAIAASTGGLSTSEFSETGRQAALDAFETEPDSADLETTLDALRAFDAAEMYDEAKTKLDSLAVLVRKWQKAWKSSNEKTQRAVGAAKDKIAFRNFQPGDLALFLPTRNSSLTTKPWAAFNISFPHFFLHAVDGLAEQLRTKEWIVARITTITDHVATNGAEGDQAEQSKGNPFQLPEGVRYFLLDVETWNGNSSAPPSLRTRKSSTAVVPSTEAVNGKKVERRRSETLITAPRESEEAETDPKPEANATASAPEAPARAKDDVMPSSFVSVRPDMPSLVGSKVHEVHSASPSGLTRALRAESPNLRRLDSPNGRVRGGPSTSVGAWSARSVGLGEDVGADAADLEGSSAGGSSSRRSTILEQATMTPAFGRGGGRNRRLGDARNLSPAAREMGDENGSDVGSSSGRRGIISAPASQSRSAGIAIKNSNSEPLEAELRKVALTNPFSQSPGPASLPADANGFGDRHGRRKSSLNISSSAAGDDDDNYFSSRNHKESIPEEETSETLLSTERLPAQQDQPKIERWPSDAAAVRTVSSSSSQGGRSASIRINGKSLVFDTSANDYRHGRKASATSAATTAISATHAVPGAFPSSVSSSNSGSGAAFAVSPSSDAALPGSLPSTHRRNSSFASAVSRPAITPAPQPSRKPSFLTQTLGRFTGASAASSANTAVAPSSPSRGNRSPHRPSLFDVHDIARDADASNAQSALKRLHSSTKLH